MAAMVLASTAFAADAGPAPAFTLTALSGEQSGLSQYKGQVVMVNFWATWCGPCQQEMPLLDQMYRKYKPAGFTLIGVNVDKEAPPVKGSPGTQAGELPRTARSRQSGGADYRGRDAELGDHRSQR